MFRNLLWILHFEDEFDACVNKFSCVKCEKSNTCFLPWASTTISALRFISVIHNLHVWLRMQITESFYFHNIFLNFFFPGNINKHVYIIIPMRTKTLIWKLRIYCFRDCWPRLDLWPLFKKKDIQTFFERLMQFSILNNAYLILKKWLIGNSCVTH